MRGLLRFAGWMVLLAALSFEAGAIGYHIGQDSVEPMQIPVPVEVPVPETYASSMKLAVYADGSIEQFEGEAPSRTEGLLYIVTVEYTPTGEGHSYSEVHVVLDFGDEGARVLSLRIPCGPVKVSVKQVGEPKRSGAEGF